MWSGLRVVSLKPAMLTACCPNVENVKTGLMHNVVWWRKSQRSFIYQFLWLKKKKTLHTDTKHHGEFRLGVSGRLSTGRRRAVTTCCCLYELIRGEKMIVVKKTIIYILIKSIIGMLFHSSAARSEAGLPSRLQNPRFTESVTATPPSSILWSKKDSVKIYF